MNLVECCLSSMSRQAQRRKCHVGPDKSYSNVYNFPKGLEICNENAQNHRNTFSTFPVSVFNAGMRQQGMPEIRIVFVL